MQRTLIVFLLSGEGKSRKIKTEPVNSGMATTGTDRKTTEAREERSATNRKVWMTNNQNCIAGRQAKI